MNFEIGVLAYAFRGSLEESLKAAKTCGAKGLQLYAIEGELAPENMDKARRAQVKQLINHQGLEIAAICGDLGGHGFARAEDNEWKVAKSKEILDLSLDLGCNIVTTHIGVVPHDPAHPRYAVMQAACAELAAYAHERGAYFAIETGPETAETLKAFLDSLPTKGVAVNMDPANLVMVTGDDPVKAVYTLKDYIVHTHAKDGKMLQKSDPEVVYNAFAEGGIEDLRLGDYFEEVPLGEGDVDFPAYLKALEDIGYHGYLTIEREAGDDPIRDISMAVEFLKGLIG